MNINETRKEFICQNCTCFDVMQSTICIYLFFIIVNWISYGHDDDIMMLLLC